MTLRMKALVAAALGVGVLIGLVLRTQPAAEREKAPARARRGLLP